MLAKLLALFKRKPYTPWTGSCLRDRDRDRVLDRRPGDKGYKDHV